MAPHAEDSDRPEADGQQRDARDWLADYSSRMSRTLEDSVRATTTSADRWARRSLSNQEWSVDTVTADAIADWEELTPLMGRWLDLWLEAAQQSFKGARPGERG